MEGDRPSFWNDWAVDAKPEVPPGKAPERLEIPGRPPPWWPAEGAAFKKPFMPGTTAATLRKSAAPKRLLANPKSAPAPPVACVGVIESCFVRSPTSSGLGALDAALTLFCACAIPRRTAKTRNGPNAEAIFRIPIRRIFMFPPHERWQC